MEVPGDMTMGEMVEEIYNVECKGKGLQYLTSITGNGSVNISKLYPNYKNITASNILLVLTQIQLRLWDGKIGGTTYAPGKSYNPSTGVLNVSGLTQESQSSYMRLTVAVYVNY